MARQLRLSLKRPAPLTRDTFIQGPSNAEAVKALDAWPRWPGGALVLVGPEGVGKTHLARTWARSARALVLDRPHPDVAAAAGRPVLIEDVDQGLDGEALFHLINEVTREPTPHHSPYFSSDAVMMGSRMRALDDHHTI